MDQTAGQAALDRVLQECAQKNLEKPNSALLQRACIFASLSARTYAVVQPSTSESQPDEPVRVTSSISTAVYETLLLPNPQPSLLSSAIWLVKDVGLVVAFRGTADLQDLIADVSFSPSKVAASNLWLHGAIYRAAMQYVPNIEAAYVKAKQHWPEQHTLPLYLTGAVSNNKLKLGCTSNY